MNDTEPSLPDPPKPRRLTAEQKQQIWASSGLLMSLSARMDSLEGDMEKRRVRDGNMSDRLFVLEQSLLAQIEANS